MKAQYAKRVLRDRIHSLDLERDLLQDNRKALHKELEKVEGKISENKAERESLAETLQNLDT